MSESVTTRLRQDIEWLMAQIREIEERRQLERLAAAQIMPGQRGDGRLYEAVDWFTKASATMRYYGRTTRLERQAHGTIVTATIDCPGMSPKKLRRAFAKADDVQLDQMARKDMPSAGVVLDADVHDDGRVGLRAVITDPVAAEKALASVYSGLVVEIDDDGIDQVFASR